MQKPPSLRKPQGNLRKIAEALEHAADCQEFVHSAPLIYLCDESKQNSFTLRLHNVQGPQAQLSDTILARLVLDVLTRAGVIASARMPGAEHFIKPTKQPATV